MNTCYFIKYILLHNFYKIKKTIQLNDFTLGLSIFILYNQFENVWLGWQDSNLRMPESESSALPLGYTPIEQINGDS